MKKFLHLDLFSGIGGFALAVDAVWPGSEHIFCDNDKFCQQVIKKHWPKSKIYGDIRQLTSNAECQRNRGIVGNGNGAESEIQSAEKTSSAGINEIGNGNTESRFDIITGGFPCQPFSQAGKRRGTEDDRYLWPEMLRVIRELHPTWIIGENVAGLLTMVQYQSGFDLEKEEYATREDAENRCNEIRGEGQGWRTGQGVLATIVADLEREGYYVQPIIIPACAVNAPHRRDRVWIVAHPQSIGIGGCASEKCGMERQGMEPDECQGGKVRGKGQGCAGEREQGASRENGNVTDTECEGYEGDINQEGQNSRCGGMPDWNQNWLEVAQRFCRVDDGLPQRMVRLPDGRIISQAKHRNESLKAYGNAIVPAVAIQIMQAIKSTQ